MLSHNAYCDFVVALLAPSGRHTHCCIVCISHLNSHKGTIAAASWPLGVTLYLDIDVLDYVT